MIYKNVPTLIDDSRNSQEFKWSLTGNGRLAYPQLSIELPLFYHYYRSTWLPGGSHSAPAGWGQDSLDITSSLPLQLNLQITVSSWVIWPFLPIIISKYVIISAILIHQRSNLDAILVRRIPCVNNGRLPLCLWVRGTEWVKGNLEQDDDEISL